MKQLKTNNAYDYPNPFFKPEHWDISLIIKAEI